MIKCSEFGKLKGIAIEKISLSNAAGMEVSVLTLGATIQSVVVPGKDGKKVDVALGYDTPQEYYENGGYFGATIGRNGNRISGSAFDLNGKHYTLTTNEGPNQLHGGKLGFDKKVWNYKTDEAKNAVTFSCKSKDGEEGFPGNVEASITFTLTEDNKMILEYRALSDQDTLVNMTNHWYINLNGQGSGDVLTHTLKVNAASYTPTGEWTIPTGEIAPVAGTALDFGMEKKIGQDIAALQGSSLKGYDNNFVLGEPGKTKEAATACGDQSGICMRVTTNTEAMQFYTGNFISERKGKGGKEYRQYSGFCLESQHFPDAINHANFPNPVLKAGENYYHRTEFAFTAK